MTEYRLFYAVGIFAIVFGFFWVALEGNYLIVRCPECHKFIGIAKRSSGRIIGSKGLAGRLCDKCFDRATMEHRNSWATRHRFDNLPFEEEE